MERASRYYTSSAWKGLSKEVGFASNGIRFAGLPQENKSVSNSASRLEDIPVRIRQVTVALAGGRAAGAVHGSRARKSRRRITGRKRPSGDNPDDLLDDNAADLPEELQDSRFANGSTSAELPLYPYGDLGEEECLEAEWEGMEAAMDDRQRYMLEWGETPGLVEDSPDDNASDYTISSPVASISVEARPSDAVASKSQDGGNSAIVPLSNGHVGVKDSLPQKTLESSADEAMGASSGGDADKEMPRDSSEASGGVTGTSTSERYSRSKTIKRRVDRSSLEVDSRASRLTVAKVQRSGGYLVLQTDSGALLEEARGSKELKRRLNGGEATSQSADTAPGEIVDANTEANKPEIVGPAQNGAATGLSSVKEEDKARAEEVAIPSEAQQGAGTKSPASPTQREGQSRGNSSLQSSQIEVKSDSLRKGPANLLTAGPAEVKNEERILTREDRPSEVLDQTLPSEGSVESRGDEWTDERPDRGSPAGETSQSVEKWEVEQDGKRPVWVLSEKEYKRLMRKQKSAEMKAEIHGRKAQKAAVKETKKVEKAIQAEAVETKKLEDAVKAEAADLESKEGLARLAEKSVKVVAAIVPGLLSADSGKETKTLNVPASPTKVAESEIEGDAKESTGTNTPNDLSGKYGSAEVSSCVTTGTAATGKEKAPAVEDGALTLGKEKKQKKKKKKSGAPGPAGKALVVARCGALLAVGSGYYNEQESSELSANSLVVAGRGWLPGAEKGAAVELVAAVVDQVKGKVVGILPTPVKETTLKVADTVALAAVDVKGQMTGIGRSMADVFPDAFVDSVGSLAEQMGDTVSQMAESVSDKVDSVSESVADKVSDITDSVSETVSGLSESVSESVSDLADSVQEKVLDLSDAVQDTVDAMQDTVSDLKGSVKHAVQDLGEQVQGTVGELLQTDNDYDEDDLETFNTPDLPEFRGRRGMDNYVILQEGAGPLSIVYDFYIYMLKTPLPIFAFGMFMTPLIVSAVFTLLYLPDFKGLALEETAEKFFSQRMATTLSGEGVVSLQEISWYTCFQVYMFSLALCTGLQPELAPLSAYALIVANVNALVAELVFVFLSGAVFARLSQPSQPVKCSAVAVMCPATPRRRYRSEAARSMLMCRYVLTGPQPSELVDVKVDLTIKYNTVTRSGAFFRAQQSLKLVRPEISFQTHGMLVRHVVDESSPLFRRTEEILKKEDAIFSLSVVGLERSSMQSIFHVQHYSVVDGDLVWNAEFEDMVLINKKNRRVLDQRKLSTVKMVKTAAASNS